MAYTFTRSTLSTVLNGMALTVLEDFVRPFAPNLNDNTATKISKGISFGFGLISYLMVFLVSNVNSILEVNVNLKYMFKKLNVSCNIIFIYLFYRLA